MMRLHRIIGCAVLAVFVFACAKLPSRPLLSEWHGEYEFGYVDKRLDSTHVRVNYKTPFVRTTLNVRQRTEQASRIVDLSFDLALWRAAEIAVRDGFPAFRVSVRHSESAVDRRSAEISAPRFTLAHPLGGFRIVENSAATFRSAWLQGSTTLDIALKLEKGADDIDARATIDRLYKKHAGANAAPAN